MKTYIVYLPELNLRSVFLTRYKAYKVRKHFKSKMNIVVHVHSMLPKNPKKADRLRNIPIYEAWDLMQIRLCE